MAHGSSSSPASPLIVSPPRNLPSPPPALRTAGPPAACPPRWPWASAPPACHVIAPTGTSSRHRQVISHRPPSQTDSSSAPDSSSSSALLPLVLSPAHGARLPWRAYQHHNYASSETIRGDVRSTSCPTLPHTSPSAYTPSTFVRCSSSACTTTQTHHTPAVQAPTQRPTYTAPTASSPTQSPIGANQLSGGHCLSTAAPPTTHLDVSGSGCDLDPGGVEVESVGLWLSAHGHEHHVEALVHRTVLTGDGGRHDDTGSDKAKYQNDHHVEASS